MAETTNNDNNNNTKKEEDNGEGGDYGLNDPKTRFIIYSVIFLLFAVLGIAATAESIENENDATEDKIKAMNGLNITAQVFWILGFVLIIVTYFAMNGMELLLKITSFIYILAGLFFFITGCIQLEMDIDNIDKLKDNPFASDDLISANEGLATIRFGLSLFVFFTSAVFGLDILLMCNNGKNRLLYYLTALFLGLIIFGGGACGTAAALSNIGNPVNDDQQTAYSLYGAGGIIGGVGALIGLIAIALLAGMDIMKLVSSGLLVLGSFLAAVGFWYRVDTSPSTNEKTGAATVGTSFLILFFCTAVAYDLSLFKFIPIGK